MAFNLEVTITGLCVFRPRPTSDPEVMDVFMVAPTSHHAGNGHTIPRHYPRVFYDAAYATGSEIPPGQHHHRISLEEAVLDLSELRGKERKVPEIQYLLDIGHFAPHPLPLPNQKEPPNLAARLTLPPGSAKSPDPRPSWKLEWPDKEEKMPKAAWHVVWTISRIDGTELKWELKGLNGTPGQPLVPLHEIDGKIKLLISNVIYKESLPELPDEFPPRPGTVLEHFRAYQDLYTGEPPWPDLIYTGPGAPEGPGGTPYSCLPSGGK